MVKQIWTLHCNGDGPFYEAHIKTKSRSSALREEGVVTRTAPVVLSRLDIYADLFRPVLGSRLRRKRQCAGRSGHRPRLQSTMVRLYQNGTPCADIAAVICFGVLRFYDVNARLGSLKRIAFYTSRAACGWTWVLEFFGIAQAGGV